MVHLASLARSRPSLVGLVSAPLPALIIGLVVMARAAVPPGIWLRNLAATLVGVLAVTAASWHRSRSPSGVGLPRWLPSLGLVLLGATLLAPGVSGVHRWLGFGPLEIHVGAVLIPALLVFLTDLDWAPSIAVATLILTVLLLQPDAAQAASFAAGWGVWAGMRRGRRAAVPIAAAVVLAGATWLRHDPLDPVPHVEGIVGMAVSQGVPWAMAGLLAIALLPVSFLLTPKYQAGAALAVYMAGTLVAAGLGNYPVPVFGYGVSPILGYYLAVVTLQYRGPEPLALQP